MPDGELYVGESREGWTRSLVRRTSGVVATPLSDYLNSHFLNVAYRPTPALSPHQLEIIRHTFYQKIGTPYRLDLCELANAGCGCSLCPLARGGMFCSELTSQLYDAAGALRPRAVWCGLDCVCGDMRKAAYAYRPYDLPLIVPSTRLGTISTPLAQQLERHTNTQ